MIINQWATTGTLSINSIIAGSGGLTKSGTITAANGIAVIGGNAAGALGAIASTFSGNVFLDAGTLQVNISSATNGNTATSTTGALGGTQNAVNIYGASTAANATVLSIKADNSTGSSTPGNIAVGNNVTVNGAFTAINVGSLGGGGGTVGSGLFLAPVNQTVQLGTLSFVNDGNTLTVTPSNGYGLEFTGTTTFNKNFTTVNVGTAAASNVVQGLTLSGQVTGTAPGGVAFTKTGAGTLVLNSASNDFVGSIIVGTGVNTAGQGGVLAFNSDAALGNAANTITLNGGGTTGPATIRAYGGGSISTSRTINLWGNSQGLTNIIEVSPGTTLTLNTALGLPAGSSLSKSDTGTLVLAANNGSFPGNINVNGGIVRFTNAGAGGLPVLASLRLLIIA